LIFIIVSVYLHQKWNIYIYYHEKVIYHLAMFFEYHRCGSSIVRYRGNV